MGDLANRGLHDWRFLIKTPGSSLLNRPRIRVNTLRVKIMGLILFFLPLHLSLTLLDRSVNHLHEMLITHMPSDYIEFKVKTKCKRYCRKYLHTEVIH